MKTKCILLISIFLLNVSVYSETEQEERTRLVQITSQIIGDLETLVLKPPKTKETEEVRDLVEITLGKLKARKLKIGIRKDLEEDIYGGMLFSLKTKKEPDPSIDISPYMLELYKTNPSIVLSAFVHECQHSKSYFDDPERFISLSGSSLEKYLYELDAYNRESKFIIGYLRENKKYNLTVFEKFLSESFEKDHLGFFSYAALGQDMELAGYLYGISELNITYEDKMKLVEDVLEKIDSEPLDEKLDNWGKYVQMVPIYSFLQFAPQSIRNIDSNHNKIPDQEKYSIQELHPALYDRILQLEKKFATNRSRYVYINTFLEKLKKVN